MDYLKQKRARIGKEFKSQNGKAVREFNSQSEGWALKFNAKAFLWAQVDVGDPCDEPVKSCF